MNGKLPHDHEEGNKIELIENHMPESGDFQTVSDIFKQLSDPTRIKIFWILCHIEECVINISAIMGMSSPAVSHHLRLLKSCGLVRSIRRGKEVYYKASDTVASDLLHHMIEKMVELSCPSE